MLVHTRTGIRTGARVPRTNEIQLKRVKYTAILKNMRLTSTTDRQYVPLVDVVRHGGIHIWNSELIIRPINRVHQVDNIVTYWNKTTV